MRHDLWDRMMYRLLQEKKEQEVKAAKKKGAKPDFLDLDGDGDKAEPMSKASKEAGDKKASPKAKKGKGKIPPQLRMYINKKKSKKSKLDEAIERLENILLEQQDLQEYGEEREPPQEEDEDFEEDDWSDWDGGEPEAGGDDSDLEGDDDDFDDYQELCPMCDKPEEECECGSEEEHFDDDGDKDELEEVEYLSESEVKKKKPALGKVTRNPAGSKKKFHVYVKCGGRVKKISFGDPGLSIKRDSPARRKNFRARHKCDKPAGKDRCTARYWSCYQWRAGKKVEGE